MRLQSSTNGESAKARAAVTAVIACCGGSGHWPWGEGWGRRSKVQASSSIRPMELRADGRREAQVPSGFQRLWPGRA